MPRRSSPRPRKQADGILAEARKAAEDSRSRGSRNLKQEIVETAVKIAETILRKTANSDLNEVFLSHILEEIGALDKADRARIDADIASNGGAVEVATSMKLTEAERDAWTKTLREQLHLRRAPSFTTEPDLIGGAELRFPHAIIRFAWSDQLKKAADILAEKRDPKV